MAIKHIVLLKFNETCDAGTIAELMQGFGALPSCIPGITSFETGQNVSQEGLDHGFTHAFVMTFVDMAARDAYLPHEKHLEFVEHLKPCMADVLVIDYELPAG